MVSPWVVDVETKGTNPASPTFMIVGLGISNQHGVLYVGGISEESQESIFWLLDLLYKFNIPLMAHNVGFDAAAIVRVFNKNLDFKNCTSKDIKWHNWAICTYTMYRHLASEGFIGQVYGLKSAQTQLLKWEETNDVKLVDWLTVNSYVNKAGKAEKGEMWRAPFEILGEYCALDCESTLLLYTHILKPVFDRFTSYQEYHTAFMTTIKLVVWQKLCGVTLSTSKLNNYKMQLTKETQEGRASFLAIPTVSAAVSKYNQKVLADFMATAPTQYKKRKALPTEPKKFNIKGEVSPTWIKWEEKRISFESSPGEESTLFRNWAVKRDSLQNAISNNLPHDSLFNLNSGTQKRWLFYDALQFPVNHWTDNESNPQPAIDEEALKEMGEEGKSLIMYNEKMKLLSMVTGCTELVVPYAEDVSRAHVGLRLPGTFTGRLGGTDGLNLQNVPKDEGYLRCWVPPPREKLLIFDVSALEPHVLAACSGDKGLMHVYGPNAIPGQDIYLFVGSQLGGEVGSAIKATGFDPMNPTKESTSRAKKDAKKYRNIAKVVHLAASYNAGPGTIRATLAGNGVNITMQEAKNLHKKYWEIFAGVKEYERYLHQAWEKNGGWFLNGIGRPICVAKDYLKDSVNRAIQSAGHDLFVYLLKIMSEILTEKGVHWKPYIMDIHDAFMITVPEEQAVLAKNLIDKEIMAELNRKIKGPVTLKGVTNIVDCWWEDKIE